MKVAEFFENYIYETDVSKYGIKDIWEIIKPDKNGKYRGDCESCALTAKKLCPVLRDFELWFCLMGGNGHAFLRNKDLMIDNNTREIITMREFRDKYKVTNIKKIHWFVIFSKRLMAKLYRLLGIID